jgi:prophage maintenance system killer protein
MPVATIHYLTVQDVLWINQELTKKECDFKFAQLEEATYCQYGYGKSRDVLKQAGTFLQGFLKMRPFSEGSQQTAFIATLAFLTINGYDIHLEPDQAGALLESVAAKRITGEQAVKQIAQQSNRPPELNPAVRTHIRSLIQKYGEALIRQDSTEAS